MPNRVTERYLQRCAQDEALRGANLAAPYPPGFTAGTGSGLLARPLFVEEAKIQAAAADAAAIVKLIGSLPDRLFDGDAARYCAAVRVPEYCVPIALQGGLRPPPPYARADMVFDGNSYHLIEPNIGSELGGCHLGLMNPVLMQVPAFRAFAKEHGLIDINPTAEIAAMLRRIAAPVAKDRDPVIAVVEWTDGFAALPELYRLFTVAMAQHGLTVHLAEATQLVNKDGKLHFGGEPIDLVLRYFMLHDVAGDPAGAEILAPILHAHAEGGTLLFTHPQTNVYSYKINLALLSDPQYASAFSTDERALIDRVLPWTRVLAPGRTDVDGQTVDLYEYCTRHRADLIVKPNVGFGARNTVAGVEVIDEEWANLLATAEPGEYVVQRRVVAELEQDMDPQTGELRTWQPIHSLYLTDQGYAGDYVRLVAAGNSAVVSGLRAVVCSAFAYREEA